MNQVSKNTILLALACLIPSVPAWAQQSYKKVQGEVIQFQQQQQTRNQDEFDHLMIRTRQGEEMRLRLGQAGQCADCVQVGDQIRARVMQGSGGQAGQIQSMKVKRDGQMYGYKNQGGQMVETQQRLRDGSGAGRQRGNNQGTGNGNCQGSGQGGGNRGGRGGGGGNGGG
jgi:hypothetical protein